MTLEHIRGSIPGSSRCTGCGAPVDPSVCWCGATPEQHGMFENHGFVPLGCECHRDTRAQALQTPKNCQACAHCYYEPDADYPICGHKDSGLFGLYVGNGRGPDSPGGHCGPDRTKFEQHPLRTPEGNLICRGSQKELGRD